MVRRPPYFRLSTADFGSPSCGCETLEHPINIVRSKSGVEPPREEPPDPDSNVLTIGPTRNNHNYGIKTYIINHTNQQKDTQRHAADTNYCSFHIHLSTAFLRLHFYYLLFLAETLIKPQFMKYMIWLEKKQIYDLINQFYWMD